MSNLGAALDYLRRGWSIIPSDSNKVPLVKWGDYQMRLPSEGEVRQWWTDRPEANVVLVAGRISGVTVLDFDIEAPYQHFMEYLARQGYQSNIPTVKSPNGWHVYFSYFPCQSGPVWNGVEIKNDRSVITLPPSTYRGVEYKWLVPIDGNPLPEANLDLVRNLYKDAKSNNAETRVTKKSKLMLYTEGHRDNTIFRVAKHLIQSGMDKDNVEEILVRLASTCDPPWTEKEARQKAESAWKHFYRGPGKQGWKEELAKWIEMSSGVFTISEIYRAFNVSTVQDKTNIRVSLHRLAEDGLIIREGKRDGIYRRAERDTQQIEWRNTEATPMDIKWPLSVESLGIQVYPSNVIVLAGDQNSGKTSYLLNFIKLNMDQYEIHYFSSEMAASELSLRLSRFDDIKADEWKFSAWERASNFADVIRPDAVNVIDYLEVLDEFWKVGRYINDIYRKLKNGIAIIALQKDPDHLLGRGKTFALEKPRLYMTMRWGNIKIVKAKNWDGIINPMYQARNFRIDRGGNIYPRGPWYYAGSKT